MRSRFAESVLFVVVAASMVSGQIVNGDFEGGATAGCPDGWSCDGKVSVFEFGTTTMVKLEEPGGGGVSRLYQVFNAPPTGPAATRIAFRYALVSHLTSGALPATIPPDGFTAYLVDPSTGLRRTLLPIDPPPSNPEFWGRGYFYEDTDGLAELNEPTVTVTGPDADSLYTVVFETDLLPGESVRLEFGLAGAGNGRTTYVVLDGVTSGCPPAYCCDDFGNILLKDDGDQCTEDICVYDQSGVLIRVDHELIECCVGCVDPGENVDIVFMLDDSGSMLQAAFASAVDAVQDVVNLYRPYALRPRIAIGRFSWSLAVPTSGPQDDGNRGAYIDVALTTDYTLLDAWLYNNAYRDGVYHRDPPKISGGWTPLSRAIKRSTSILTDPNRRRYMVLLTDGFTNKPTVAPGSPTDPSCSQRCTCPAARSDANSEASLAKATGIQIYVKLYYSDDNGACSQGNWCDNYSVCSWLTGDIATSPDTFWGHDGPPDPSEFPCDFVQIVQIINCDDDNPCTRDNCVGGHCTHDLISPPPPGCP